eukprot:m.101940 g.101940  ORF g.101940 m.101940 type:complete len:235 (+) comp20785_c0_seq1:148-852(+)
MSAPTPVWSVLLVLHVGCLAVHAGEVSQLPPCGSAIVAQTRQSNGPTFVNTAQFDVLCKNLSLVSGGAPLVETITVRLQNGATRGLIEPSDGNDGAVGTATVVGQSRFSTSQLYPSAMDMAFPCVKDSPTTMCQCTSVATVVGLNCSCAAAPDCYYGSDDEHSCLKSSSSREVCAEKNANGCRWSAGTCYYSYDAAPCTTTTVWTVFCIYAQPYDANGGNVVGQYMESGPRMPS